MASTLGKYSGGPGPTAPPTSGSGPTSVNHTAQSLIFRKVVASKRGELCMHFVAPSGCALGALCPYRHAGAQRTVTAPAAMLGTEDNAPQDSTFASPDSKPQPPPTRLMFTSPHVTVSPLYSQPLCARARGLVLWFFADLPTVTNSATPPTWTQFDEEWATTLEAEYTKALQHHKYHRNMPSVEFKKYTIEFARMYMCRTVDGGSRRPIQRALVSASPTWVMEEMDVSHERNSDVVSEVIDSVASSTLEYHYVHGARDLLTIDINRWKLRINLLTMVGREVRERRRSLFHSGAEGKDRFRVVASAVLNSSRLGASGPRAVSPEEIVSPTSPPTSNHRSPFSSSTNAQKVTARSIIHRPSATPRPPATTNHRNGSASAATGRQSQTAALVDAPAKRFRLRRLPITVRLGCPPSDPYNTSGLQVRLTVIAKGTNRPIQSVDGTRLVRDHDGWASFVFPVALDLNELTAATFPDAPCDAVGQCHWESGHHLWTHSHRCPAGKASSCFLCGWATSTAGLPTARVARSPSAQSSSDPLPFSPPAAATLLSSGRDVSPGAPPLHHRRDARLPYRAIEVGVLEERGDVHRLLMSHEPAPVGSTFEAARSSAVSRGQAATGPWRRHQAVSRWYRSEWDGGSRMSLSAAPAMAASATTMLTTSGLLSGSSHGMGTPFHSGGTSRPSSVSSFELHRVRPHSGNHEVIQLLSLMQRGQLPGAVMPAVASRRRSAGASLLWEGGDGYWPHPSSTSMGQSMTSSALATPAATSPKMPPPKDDNAAGEASPSPSIFRQSVQQIEQQHALAVEQCHAARTMHAALSQHVTEERAYHQRLLPGDRLHESASAATANSTSADDGDVNAALQGLQIQRIQHNAFYSRYLRARTEMFLEWFDTDAETAEQSREEALFRYIPRSWLRSVLLQESEGTGGVPFDADVDDGHRGDLLRGWNQQRMHFYRDLESAGAEPRVPGVPYLLLVAVAFPGAAVRLSNAEALQIVAAPLVVPWHVNTAADDDQAHRYQTYHSVVCDEHTSGPPSQALTPSALVATTAQGADAPFSTSVFSSVRSPSRSPRHASGSRGSDLVSPKSASSAQISSQLSATAKKVFLYDPTQWCPMYLVFV